MANFFDYPGDFILLSGDSAQNLESPRLSGRVDSTAVGSVMIIGLSIKGCLHSKKTSLMRGNKADQSGGLGCGDFKGSMPILAEPSFPLLTQEDERRLCLQGVTWCPIMANC